jgi:hypothetical protein
VPVCTSSLSWMCGRCWFSVRGRMPSQSLVNRSLADLTEASTLQRMHDAAASVP